MPVNTQLVIGTVFAFILIVFFMIAYFFSSNNPGQSNILRVLASVLAGSTGAFLTGGVVIKISGPVSPGTNWAISAAGGAALFVLVWITWHHKLKAAFKCTIPQGSNFNRAVDIIAAIAGKSAQSSGFSESELDQKLAREINIDTKTPRLALENLGRFFPNNSIPNYSVSDSSTGWVITKNNS